MRGVAARRCIAGVGRGPRRAASCCASGRRLTPERARARCCVARRPVIADARGRSPQRHGLRREEWVVVGVREDVAHEVDRRRRQRYLAQPQAVRAGELVHDVELVAGTGVGEAVSPALAVGHPGPLHRVQERRLLLGSLPQVDEVVGGCSGQRR